MSSQDDDASFTSYVRSRQAHLARFAYLLTGDVAAAEDLVQSALAKAYRRWHRLSESPDAYLRRVIVNENNNIWRRAWRRREVPGGDLVTYAEHPGVPDEVPDPDLRRLIMALPRQQRAALVLRYYEDLSEAQTAAVLGCSTGTVKSHTSRALRSLRTTMKERTS